MARSQEFGTFRALGLPFRLRGSSGLVDVLEDGFDDLRAEHEPGETILDLEAFASRRSGWVLRSSDRTLMNGGGAGDLIRVIISNLDSSVDRTLPDACAYVRGSTFNLHGVVTTVVAPGMLTATVLRRLGAAGMQMISHLTTALDPELRVARYPRPLVSSRAEVVSLGLSSRHPEKLDVVLLRASRVMELGSPAVPTRIIKLDTSADADDAILDPADALFWLVGDAPRTEGSMTNRFRTLEAAVRSIPFVTIAVGVDLDEAALADCLIAAVSDVS